MVKIQEDYWTVTMCVTNEVPWQVPGSVHRLDGVCRNGDTVLEIGTGGSTLFYARRCKWVVAIETNSDWYGVMSGVMSGVMKERGITNVTYLLMRDLVEIEKYLSGMNDCSIVSVDFVHGYNRSRFLSTILGQNKKFRVLVLDNYSDPALFPDHFLKDFQEIVNLCPTGQWVGEDYNDSHW